MTSSSGKPNRLLHESSPYLQQHAYNPVDWFPWGDEAIARAKELDRPIFLSIGSVDLTTKPTVDFVQLLVDSTACAG